MGVLKVKIEKPDVEVNSPETEKVVPYYISLYAKDSSKSDYELVSSAPIIEGKIPVEIALILALRAESRYKVIVDIMNVK